MKVKGFAYRGLVGLAGIIVFLAVLIAVSPYIALTYITSELEKSGAKDVSFGEWDIGLWPLSLTSNAIQITVDDDRFLRLAGLNFSSVIESTDLGWSISMESEIDSIEVGVLLVPGRVDYGLDFSSGKVDSHDEPVDEASETPTIDVNIERFRINTVRATIIDSETRFVTQLETQLDVQNATSVLSELAPTLHIAAFGVPTLSLVHNQVPYIRGKNISVHDLSYQDQDISVDMLNVGEWSLKMVQDTAQSWEPILSFERMANKISRPVSPNETTIVDAEKPALENRATTLENQAPASKNDLNITVNKFEFSLKELLLAGIKENDSLVAKMHIEIHAIKKRTLAADTSGEVANLTLDTFTLSNFLVDYAESPYVKLAYLGVEDVQFNSMNKPSGDLSQEALIGGISIQGSEVNLRREENQQLFPLSQIQSLLTSFSNGELATETIKSENPEPSSSQASSFHWVLSNILMEGENKIHFRDEAVTPPVSLGVMVDTVSIGKIDSDNPEGSTPIAMTLSLDSHNRFDIEGGLSLLQPDHSGDIQVSIKELDLSPFSPYVSPHIGYSILAGQMNLDTKASILKNKMDVKNDFLFNQLTLKKTNNEAAASMESTITMPLETALDLLRDKQGDIALSIPITGNVDDPQFSVSDVIKKASANAMKKASLTYLKLAVQPWGALLMAGEMVGKQSNGIGFEPIIFLAGSSEIQEKDMAYVKKMGTLLQDKEGLRLKVCPVTSLQDKTFFESSTAEPKTDTAEALKKLALERANAIKQQLTTTYSIASDRLLICNPEYSDESNPPFVRLQL